MLLDWYLERQARGIDHTDARRRRRACDALRRLGNAHAVVLLIGRLGDTDPEVRVAAANALEQLGEKRLADAVSGSTSALSEVAARQDRRLVEPLISLLADSEWLVRRRACEALKAFQDVRAVEPLIERLTDSEPYVRDSACIALAAHGDTRAVEPLIGCLADGMSYVRKSACEALGALGDARAVEPLCRLVGDQPAAHRALGLLGDLRAVEPLLAWLRAHEPDKADLTVLGSTYSDPESDKRSTACEALGQLGDTRAVDQLVNQLNGNSIVRSAACAALGKLGDARAVVPLIKSLGDPDPGVRDGAGAALRRLGDGQLVDASYGEATALAALREKADSRLNLLRRSSNREVWAEGGKFPEVWVENNTFQQALFRMVMDPNARNGKGCPYFEHRVCKFRVIAQGDTSLGPERCSLLEEDYRKCHVWKLAPR
jgi:HEAT repeat protein